MGCFWVGSEVPFSRIADFGTWSLDGGSINNNKGLSLNAKAMEKVPSSDFSLYSNP